MVVLRVGMLGSMGKVRQSYVCRSCGTVFPKWLGRCSDCGEWDTLEEQREDKGGVTAGWGTVQAVARSIAEVGTETNVARFATGIGEFDRVLGVSPDGSAGIVPGSVLLVGGEPGVGKSTLLLQAAGAWALGGARVLYVSSEESAEQIRLRAQRLGIGTPAELFLLAETSLGRMCEQARTVKPAVIVIDSVQMTYSEEVEAAPGSVSQLRRCGADLVMLAKATGTAVVLVGHVTKDGQLAGPRLLEHLVDAVLYFEGDRLGASRIIRAVKNRYGATLELGIFSMTGQGLIEMPGGASISADRVESGPGAVVCPVVHGSRCVLAEMQALTATGFLGSVKRKSSGLDASRLAMIVAVLEQHGGLRLADRDIFAQSVGGLRIIEPASDLAVLMAVAGAERRLGLEQGVCVVGEVSLSGRISTVGQLEMRVGEASRLGYRRVLVPAGSAPEGVGDVELVAVRSVADALEHLG
jgi:DNA repair protein RadA/Sms